MWGFGNTISMYFVWYFFAAYKNIKKGVLLSFKPDSTIKIYVLRKR